MFKLLIFVSYTGIFYLAELTYTLTIVDLFKYSIQRLLLIFVQLIWSLSGILACSLIIFIYLRVLKQEDKCFATLLNAILSRLERRSGDQFGTQTTIKVPIALPEQIV